ncbi:TPA: hypothetical protein O4549_001000 [Staphylococcus aureus]|nr:hypothetical protein [Staphylococcus aureus]
MRVNVLQHTPNEGVGYIGEWAKESGHEVYIYHPYMNDGVLPLAEETDMFQIPQQAELLFSGNHIRNQGFIIDHHVIGLQFHFEPGPDDVREMVLNDAQYINHSILEQSAEDILAFEVPKQNRQAIFRILDFITQA